MADYYKLGFTDSLGNVSNITVPKPDETKTDLEISTAMDSIVTSNAYKNNSVTLLGKNAATLVTSTKSQLV